MDYWWKDNNGENLRYSLKNFLMHHYRTLACWI